MNSINLVVDKLNDIKDELNILKTKQVKPDLDLDKEINLKELNMV